MTPCLVLATISAGLCSCPQAKAPLYVHRDVWNTVSKPVGDSTVHRLLNEVKGGASSQFVSMDQQQQQQQGNIAHTTNSRGGSGGSATPGDYAVLRSEH